MPLLGNLLIAIVTTLFNFFSKFMLMERAFRLAALLVMIGLAVTMIALMSSCARGVCAQGISGISASHPNFAVGLGIAFNSTTLTSAACYMSVWLGCQLYVFQKKGLQLVTK